MVIFLSVVLNVILVYVVFKLLSSHTDLKRDSDLKTHYFNQMVTLVWDHGLFMDSSGSVSAPGAPESQEIVAHWNKYHTITTNFKDVGRSYGKTKI